MQVLKKYWIIIFVIFLIVIASFLIWQKLHPTTLSKNLIEGSGRIDGDLINLNTKYPGRVEKILIQDGMKIKKGDIVAILGSKEYEAQKAQIYAQIDAQKSTLQAKIKEYEIAKTTIPVKLEKAKEQLKSQQLQLKILKDKIQIQKKVLSQAEKDYKRYLFLYKNKSIDSHSFELSKLKLDSGQTNYNSLLLKLSQLKTAISIAQNTLKEAKASQEQLSALKDSLEALKKSIKALEASKSQIEAILSELVIKSPINGYVVEKIANVGEVIGAGMSIATLLDPHSLYLKIFVDTINNGKIKIGDKAVIFLDAYPNKPIYAKVVRIAQKAEFTPKEVSVRSDRIQRVFAVDLKPLKVNPLLKLGIPAIGVISIDGKDLPSSLNDIPVL